MRELLSEYGIAATDLPKLAGTYTGHGLVVVGDAIGVWNDLEAFGCRVNHHRGCVAKQGYHFLTVNKAVESFPGNIEHAYSNEPHLLEKFIAARRSEYAKEFHGPNHTHSCNVGARHRWPWGGHGTSLLGATLAGVWMGYIDVVICGGPLDDGPHNGEPPWRKCRFATSEAAGPRGDNTDGMDAHWKRAINLGFEGKVKSMSGRTKLWLGSPSPAF